MSKPSFFTARVSHGLRLLVFAGVIFGLGSLWGRFLPHDPSLNLAGFSIIAGFFSVTVLAAIRLAVPKLRDKLSGQETVMALLCIFLLIMQGIVAILWATGAPVFYRLIYANSQYERFYWFLSWALVQALSCVAVSRLWGMRAYEIALGSALFWFWSVTYFVVRLLLLGHSWGIDFGGRVWIS